MVVDEVDGIGLGEAIGQLRDELIQVQTDGGSESGIRFELGAITLVLQTVATVNANGSIGWKIIQVGGSVQSQATQTLTLTLLPRQRDAVTGAWEDPLVSDRLDSSALAPPERSGDAGEPPGDTSGRPPGDASGTDGPDPWATGDGEDE